MFKIGKLQTADHEKVNIEVKISEIWEYKNGKKIKTEERPELEIEIEGQIDKEKYAFHFYIDKPFEEYLKMKNYERIKLENCSIKDDEATINDQFETFPIMSTEVLRLNSTLVFVVCMKSTFDDYFATTEFNVPLSTIENALKKD
jgi:hypothetical protein